MQINLCSGEEVDNSGNLQGVDQQKHSVMSEQLLLESSQWRRSGTGGREDSLLAVNRARSRGRAALVSHSMLPGQVHIPSIAGQDSEFQWISAFLG